MAADNLEPNYCYQLRLMVFGFSYEATRMSHIRKMARLSANLLKISFANPKRLSHVLGAALSASEEVADKGLDLLRFPQVTVGELLSGEGLDLRVTLALFPEASSSISELEALGLVLLLKKAKAVNVFEFGTYKGVSITQLALNLPKGSRIFTLDLPDDDPRSVFAITAPHDLRIAREKGKGSLVPEDARAKIQFLAEDSATFDEKPLCGQMDFVFVDGAHNEDYVRNDSEKAWRMLRPGGVVAWHDCRIHDEEVVRYLLQSSFKPVRIVGTSLAFAAKP